MPGAIIDPDLFFHVIPDLFLHVIPDSFLHVIPDSFRYPAFTVGSKRLSPESHPISHAIQDFGFR